MSFSLMFKDRNKTLREIYEERGDPRTLWQKFKGWKMSTGFWPPSFFWWNIKNICAYIPVLWNNQDCDWSGLLLIMSVKLRRMSDHIREHNIIQGAEKTSREILMASELCRRMSEEDYLFKAKDFDEETKLFDRDMELFCRLFRKKLRCWWD